MSLPPPNIARQDEADEAHWARQERALRGDPVQVVAAASLLRLASAVPAAGALGLLGAWTLGEILSDRFWWSQFLEWIPTVLLLPSAGLLLVLGEVARRLMHRTRPGERTNTRLARSITIGASAWAVILVYFIFAELGGLRMIGVGRSIPPGVTPTRVLFWNSGGEDLLEWTHNIIDAHPALCVMTSLDHLDKLPPLAESMSKDPANDPVWVFTHDRFTILSRARLLRVGYTQLDISRGAGLDPREQGPNRYYDPGRAMFFEVDSSLVGGASGGKPIVIWVVDLPSDLSLPKALITEQAASAIAAFRGPVMKMTADGRWTDDPAERIEGFPPPDMIVGDFNIPRGSRSMRQITRVGGAGGVRLEHAWNQGGHGYTATYPRQRPLWAIDHIFLAPHLRAVDFESFSVGTGTHRAVWADIVPGQ